MFLSRDLALNVSCWFALGGPSVLGPSREIIYSNVSLKIMRQLYNVHNKLIHLVGNQRVGIFPLKSKILFSLTLTPIQGRHLRGAGRPSPPKEKEKRKKERKKKKRGKKKKKEIKNGTMNNVKLLHIKCCLPNFSIVRWH